MHMIARRLVTSVALLASLVPVAQAADVGALGAGPWSDSASSSNGAFMIAQSSAPAGNLREATGGPQEELPWYTKNRMHKYLGLGSMGLALGTLAAPKEEDGAHEKMAKAAAVLGVAAVANGIYAHWDDMDFTWDDPDTRHALLGALGTLGYILSVAKGGEGGHAAMGGLGAVAMAYAIKISW